MATITSVELKVYAGTNTSGSQVGSTIVKSGSPSTVDLNLTNLGLDLSPGSQYCVIARCTNSDDYTTEYTRPYPFKTLIYTEILTISGGNASISPELSFTYDNRVISVQECGIYYSVNASGANATKVAASDQQEAEQGWMISGLAENTTYFCIPYVVDDLGREYKGDWVDAETVNTGYANPTVVITNVATTSRSITGNVTVTSSDTIAEVLLRIIPTGGGSYQYKTLAAQNGMQTWSVSDGDLDDSSNVITINPSTEYRIEISATGSHSGSGIDRVVATTATQSTETIAITSISNIGIHTATVNLAYGETQELEPGR